MAIASSPHTNTGVLFDSPWLKIHPQHQLAPKSLLWLKGAHLLVMFVRIYSHTIQKRAPVFQTQDNNVPIQFHLNNHSSQTSMGISSSGIWPEAMDIQICQDRIELQRGSCSNPMP
eukprot:scaffold54225_cov47-Attheya_sp.AAC.2